MVAVYFSIHFFIAKKMTLNCENKLVILQLTVMIYDVFVKRNSFCSNI